MTLSVPEFVALVLAAYVAGGWTLAAVFAGRVRRERRERQRAAADLIRRAREVAEDMASQGWFQ